MCQLGAVYTHHVRKCESQIISIHFFINYDIEKNFDGKKIN